MISSEQPNTRRKRLKFLLFIFLLFPAVLAILLLTYRTYMQKTIRAKSKISTAAGIESLERVTLGGVEQWILIRASDQSKPLLLWLHGGPGATSLPLASQHDTELVKHFVVVHWDQRGAGKSYSADLSESAMTVEQFVSDTYELTQLLIERFNRPKVYLIGHSWGTTVGILAAKQHPDLYHAFVGIGQSVSDEGEVVGYQFALEQATRQENQNALNALESIGPPPWTTVDQYSTYARWINTFGGTGRQYTILDYIRDLLFSPDYTLRDVYRFQAGQRFSLVTMLENGELQQINLFEQAGTLEIPIYFFQGRHDYSTPGEVVEKYYEAVQAPQKSLIWFEESAHFPQWEEPEKFTNELLEILP